MMVLIWWGLYYYYLLDELVLVLVDDGLDLVWVEVEVVQLLQQLRS